MLITAPRDCSKATATGSAAKAHRQATSPKLNCFRRVAQLASLPLPAVEIFHRDGMFVHRPIQPHTCCQTQRCVPRLLGHRRSPFPFLTTLPAGDFASAKTL